MFTFLQTHKEAISKIASKPQMRIQKVPASKLTPLMVCEALQAPVLLESAFLESGKGRFSILVIQEAFRILKEKGQCYVLENATKHILDSLIKISDWTLPKNPKFLDFVEAFSSLAPNLDSTFEENLPLPLGGVGYLGYEFFSDIEEMEFCKEGLYQASENAFIFGREFVVFDHFYEVLYAINVVYAHETQEYDIDTHNAALVKKLTHLKPSHKEPTRIDSKIISSSQESYFTQMVETLKEEIYKGNLLQCVPSQSLQITSNLPPLEAYKNLRSHNPSPYMYYFDFGEYQIVGSSPEVLLKVQSNDAIATLTVRPIAGTRPRGKNALEDSKFEEELRLDSKENAEHLMLLDLGRNDIGKVAIPQSVRVTQEKIIEKYARVMHLVSEVQGQMDLIAHKKIDALYSAFPAGTVSGAPKIAAIKAIESLESHRRNIYAGAIGYFSKNGDMNFAIAIRTAVYQKGVYYLQAGAGIVYDSNPKAEFIETQNKMRALSEAILGVEP